MIVKTNRQRIGAANERFDMVTTTKEVPVSHFKIPNVRTVEGRKYHLRENGELLRQTSSGYWEHMVCVSDSVKSAFGITGQRIEIQASGFAAEIFTVGCCDRCHKDYITATEGRDGLCPACAALTVS